MTEAKLNSTDISEKMNDGNDNKEEQLDSLQTVSRSLSSIDSSTGGQTGMFNEGISLEMVLLKKKKSNFFSFFFSSCRIFNWSHQLFRADFHRGH